MGPDLCRNALTGDVLAAVIVTIMLIPQSLAYALLAGLPPEAGLYASIAPIILYAIFGTSRALAVGPVAVVSLMTAAAIGNIADQGTTGYAVAALTLAAMSGAILLVMGLLKLGFLANFLSHPVIAGFITASGILIATSQIKHILGISAGGDTLPAMVISLVGNLSATNWITLVIGVGATTFLFWVRKGLKPLLCRIGLGPILAGWAGACRDGNDGGGLGPRAGCTGDPDRWRGAAGPASTDAAVVFNRSDPPSPSTSAADLGHRLR